MTGAKWSGPHRRLSEQMRAHALGRICHFCGLPMLPGQPLDLDHAPDGRSYRGVTHRGCNRADGARKSLAIKRARRGQQRRGYTVRNEVALGVEIAIDRGHSSIVRAGRGRDGRIVVELAAYVAGTDHSSTIRNMVASHGKHNVLAVMLNPRSPAATLLEPLRLLRVDVTEASTHVVSAAPGWALAKASCEGVGSSGMIASQVERT